MKHFKTFSFLAISCLLASGVESKADTVEKNPPSPMGKFIVQQGIDKNTRPVIDMSPSRPFIPGQTGSAPTYENSFDPTDKVSPNKNVVIDSQLKRMAGQMVMVGFRGTAPEHAGVKAVISEISQGSIGGVMLMKHNIVSIAQVKRLTNALYKAAKAGNQPTPFISVDQEGGLVQRLRFTQYPSAAKIAKLSEHNAAVTYGKMACEIQSAGINVNFGPVVDLDINGRNNPVIGRLNRSYGRSPSAVIKYASQFVSAHKYYGIMTAAKHFPGHGSSLKDSHKGFTAIPQWSEKELEPYRALAKGGPGRAVDLVMVGHLYNQKWKSPASLSNTAITRILREKVHFRGLAITDDMEMGAIRHNYKWSEAIIKAVNAGNDILLYSNTAKTQSYLGKKIRDTITNAICPQGRDSLPNCVPVSVIVASYDRIRTTKGRLKSHKKSGSCAK